MSCLKKCLFLGLLPFVVALLPSLALGDELANNANALVEAEAEAEATHANIHNKQDKAHLAESIFHSMDSNHDSSLSLNEFVSNFSVLEKEKDTGSRKGSGGTGTSGQKSGFWRGFSSSTMMIIATEIGDKTFFIAAVLSMRNSRLVVFAGAILALACMTVLSTMMGLVLPSIMPKQYTHIIGGILFLYFGIKLVYESRSMSDKVSDELEEVEEELLQHNKKDDEADLESGGGGVGGVNSAISGTGAGSSSNSTGASSSSSPSSLFDQKIFMQAFLLTFLAEWGDRSQIATIALAAAKNPYGVTLGGCLGHSLCTGMAVVGGRMLASKISEKTVSFWGGLIFLAFGVHSLCFDSAE